MKPAAETLLLLCLVALAAASCRPAARPVARWALELSAEKDGVYATFRLSTLTAIPGATMEGELDVQSPAATPVAAPQFKPAGLELVDFAALPVRLDKSGREIRGWRWSFQAGAPGVIRDASVRVQFNAAGAPGSLVIALPDVVIRSAFAPGRSTDGLPPLEVPDAL